MPTVFCVGGVSGTGKSTLIRESLLEDLPRLDIADIYNDNEGISKQEARWKLMQRLRDQLEDDDSSSIVMEAFFCPNSHQRREVMQIADDYDFRVRFIWCSAPREVCRERVMEDYYGYGNAWYQERYRARMSFIDSAQDWHFEPRDDESMPHLDSDTCAECGSWPLELPDCSWCSGRVDTDLCCHCSLERGHTWTCSQACRNAQSGRSRRRRGRR